jgi:hypothetical protein
MCYYTSWSPIEISVYRELLSLVVGLVISICICIQVLGKDECRKDHNTDDSDSWRVLRLLFSLEGQWLYTAWFL